MGSIAQVFFSFHRDLSNVSQILIWFRQHKLAEFSILLVNIKKWYPRSKIFSRGTKEETNLDMIWIYLHRFCGESNILKVNVVEMGEYS